MDIGSRDVAVAFFNTLFVDCIETLKESQRAIFYATDCKKRCKTYLFVIVGQQ